MSEEGESTSVSESRYIYHEKQDAMLCGQHCLNNLMQIPFSNPIQLSQIAGELDEEERKAFYEMGKY